MNAPADDTAREPGQGEIHESPSQHLVQSVTPSAGEVQQNINCDHIDNYDVARGDEAAVVVAEMTRNKTLMQTTTPTLVTRLPLVDASRNADPQHSSCVFAHVYI